MVPTKGDCAAITIGAGDAWQAKWDLTPTACDPFGEISLNAPMGDQLLACGATATATCESAANVCAPPSREGVSLCIMKEGENLACPGEYPNAETAYSSYADHRTCPACECESQPGDCTGRATAHLDATCGGVGVSSDDQACQTGAMSAYGSVEIKIPKPPTCNSTAASKVPAGDVTASGAVTVCCR
jgi:hypothetical protein